jgi:hypothetical protein
MRWVVALILSAAFLAPANAQDGCAPIEYFAPLADRVPVFRILRGDKLQTAIRIYNENPPESDTPWRFAALIIRQDGSGFLMVGMENSVCEHMQVSPDGIREMLLKLDGQTA